MADILTSINTRKTPQGRKAREDQVKNTAGGYVFQVGDEARLHRFLTLGTDGNSYYTSAAALTRQNADVVFRMAANKPDELIAQILAVSEAGRAPKNKQAIFALAIAASTHDTGTRVKAMAVMHRVCRTGTHVFEFNKYVEQFRGRGPSLNKAISRWYTNKPLSKVAYQAVKYRAREDWTHRDLLRLAKPGQWRSTQNRAPGLDPLFDWITKGEVPGEYYEGLEILEDYLECKSLEASPNRVVGWVTMINRAHGMTWEMLPDAALKSPEVWEALIAQGIPQTALMRQLPRLTNVFGGQGNWVGTVAAQLQDAERLKKGRVHPVNVLVAQRTYARGHGEKGNTSWTPVTALVDALDGAFYNAYGAVEPTGKRRLVALDVSGSMGHTIGGYPLTCREVGAALALVSVATEAPGLVEVVGFTSGRGGGARGAPSRRFAGYNAFGQPVYYAGYSYGGAGYEGGGAISPLDISNRRRLDDVIAYTTGLPFGGTDCALPFTWAMEKKRDFDSVEIITDNETWAGPIHVHQAATQYRNQVGHDVKLIATGLTATNYSVVDPQDPSGLNVSGFDSAVPQLISDFAASRL